jgi:hypothetical protein
MPTSITNTDQLQQQDEWIMDDWLDANELADVFDSCQSDHNNPLAPLPSGIAIARPSNTHEHDAVTSSEENGHDDWIESVTLSDDLLPPLLRNCTDQADGTFVNGSFMNSTLERLQPPPFGDVQCSFEPFVPYSYYPFVENSAAYASSDVVSFLEMMHCFHLPNPTILNEFILQYFLHVHPNIPVLDEGAFMKIYGQGTTKPGKGRGIPLLLLQAMLFASCTVRQKERY